MTAAICAGTIALAFISAGKAVTGKSFNGSFEAVGPANRPHAWTFFYVPPAEVALTSESRTGYRAVRLFSSDTAIAGVQPDYAAALGNSRPERKRRGLVTFWYKARKSAVRGTNLTFCVIPLDSLYRERGPRAVFTVPEDHVGDQQWHAGQLEYNFTGPNTKFALVAARINESLLRGAGEWLIDDIVVSSIGPRLRVREFGTANPVCLPGDTVAQVLEIVNDGDTPERNINVVFEAYPPDLIIRPRQKSIVMLSAGSSTRVRTTLIPPNEAAYRIKAQIRSANTDWVGVADLTAARALDQPTSLQNRTLRLTFVRTSIGFPFFRIEGRKNGDFFPLGIGSLATVLDVNYHWPGKVIEVPTQVAVRDTILELTGSQSRWVFAAGQNSASINITCQFRADDSCIIYDLSGIRLYAGEGTFGSRKADALFPGLEWLVNNEASSGTLDVFPEHRYRFRPHPLKITIPLMALRSPTTAKDSSGFLIALLWDPNQPCPGGKGGWAATFSSPNSLNAQSNHLLRLSIPSVPEAQPENQLGRGEGLRLATGDSLCISGRLIVIPDQDLLAAVDYWQTFLGQEPPPRLDVSNAISRSLSPFTGVLWNQMRSGWHHTLPDIWPPSLDPTVLKLIYLSSRIRQPLAARLPPEAASALSSGRFVPGDLGWAFASGHIIEGLDHERTLLDDIVRRQSINGAWVFCPADTELILARVPDPAADSSAVGLCAQQTLRLLRYSRIVGDSTFERAAMTGLGFIEKTFRDQYAVPRGAELWEVPIHAPDLLAAAYAVLLYVEAFRVTGDTNHLQRAVYWARAGLPFIYLWKAPGKAIMRYGSVPVFGASWYSYPWFGRLVQWTGLDYAYALIQLSAYDRSKDWRSIATGITQCAAQQQSWVAEHIPGHSGLYPDAFDVMAQQPPGLWNVAPIGVLRNALELGGVKTEVSTCIIKKTSTRHRPIVISAINPFSCSTRNHGPDIRIRLDTPVSGASHLLIAGVDGNARISLNGKPLRARSVGTPQESWYEYSDMYRAAVVRIVHQMPVFVDLSARR